MDRHRYAQLMMQSLRKEKPIDQDNVWTMLDEDPALSESHVPCAFWHPFRHMVSFGEEPTENQGYSFQFRRSVGGDVPNS